MAAIIKFGNQETNYKGEISQVYDENINSLTREECEELIVKIRNYIDKANWSTSGKRVRKKEMSTLETLNNLQVEKEEEIKPIEPIPSHSEALSSVGYTEVLVNEEELLKGQISKPQELTEQDLIYLKEFDRKGEQAACLKIMLGESISYEDSPGYLLKLVKIRDAKKRMKA